MNTLAWIAIIFTALMVLDLFFLRPVRHSDQDKRRAAYQQKVKARRAELREEKSDEKSDPN